MNKNKLEGVIVLPFLKAFAYVIGTILGSLLISIFANVVPKYLSELGLFTYYSGGYYTGISLTRAASTFVQICYYSVLAFVLPLLYAFRYSKNKNEAIKKGVLGFIVTTFVIVLFELYSFIRGVVDVNGINEVLIKECITGTFILLVAGVIIFNTNLKKQLAYFVGCLIIQIVIFFVFRGYRVGEMIRSIFLDFIQIYGSIVIIDACESEILSCIFIPNYESKQISYVTKYDNYPTAKPWVRWAARIMDFSFEFSFSFIVLMWWQIIGADTMIGNAYRQMEESIAMKAGILFSILEIVLLILFCCFMDSLISDIWGNTLGKWCFGVKVINEKGEKLNFGKLLRRNINVLWNGCGFFIPGIVVITNLYQYHKLHKYNMTNYDIELNCNVIEYEKRKLKMLLGILLLIISLILLCASNCAIAAFFYILVNNVR